MSLERPDYRDSNDRKLYEELFYQNKFGKKLSAQEETFVTRMYHMEEYLSGLGGDRE